MVHPKIKAAAAKWLVELETADRIESVWPAFEAWLAEDPQNREAFRQFEDASRRMDSLRDLRPISADVDPNFLSVIAAARFQRDHRRRRVRALWKPAIAVLVALLLIPMGLWWWTANSWESFETDYGRHHLYLLPDGSSIDLNTNSRLRVHLTSSHRDVILVRGEVSFGVAHDARRPFVVHVGSSKITVIGTTFTVRRKEDNELETIVTQGRVEVVPGQHASADPGAVSAGQVAIVGPQGIRIKTLDKDTIKRRLSWQNGTLSFQGETVAQAAEEFNRYNRRKIIVVDPSIANRHIGGTFSATDPDGFVAILEQGFGIRHESNRAEDPTSVIQLTGDPRQ